MQHVFEINFEYVLYYGIKIISTSINDIIERTEHSVKLNN